MRLAAARTLSTLELWGSEQECGVGTNDWRYARYGWQTIKRYFEHGATVWTYWNMAMPQGGMSGWGWPQNSLVEVDTSAGTFRLGEDYWLVRHLRHMSARRAAGAGGKLPRLCRPACLPQSRWVAGAGGQQRRGPAIHRHLSHRGQDLALPLEPDRSTP
jgi:hypothetical protein